MNINDLSTQLLYTTVPIWVQNADRSQSFGTAFILSMPVPGSTSEQIPLLVTNAHVVSNGERGIIEFTARQGDLPKQGTRIKVEISSESMNSFLDRVNDLAILPIGGLLNQLEQAGNPVFFRSVAPVLIPSPDVLSDMGAMEDVIFIGYPSGLYDEHNAMPLIRRGITSTPPWNNFMGRPEFLIDAGVFPGSSGSPIFIFNNGSYSSGGGLVVGSRLLFLGVLSESILRAEEKLPPVYLGIGKALKSSVVGDFASRVCATILGSNASFVPKTS